MRPAFFVFCEGKSEALYVKMLKAQYRVPVEINIKVVNDISDRYVRQFKKQKDSQPKDKTFLMYDLDKPEIKGRLLSVQDAVLLLSNPCLELWYLLYFKEQKAAINCKSCKDELLKKHNNYRKNHLDNKLREIFRKRQGEAVNRAKKLRDYDNPSTLVFLLIEELEKHSG